MKLRIAGPSDPPSKETKLRVPAIYNEPNPLIDKINNPFGVQEIPQGLSEKQITSRLEQEDNEPKIGYVDPKGHKTGKYPKRHVEGIIKASKVLGIDPYQALALGLQESGFTTEKGKIGRRGFVATPSLGQVHDFEPAQEKELQETMKGVPQTTSEIGGPIDLASYAMGKAGNVVGLLPGMVTGPVFPFLLEKGEAYKGGITETEKATGLSRDEILALDLDKTARENSDVSGAINAGLETLGTLTVFGRLIPKSVAGKLITKIFTSKIGAPTVGGLGEGGTEWLQSLDTKIASKLSAVDANGNKLYKDVFEAVNAITPEEWTQMKEEFYGGTAGGSTVAFAGSLIKEKKANTNPVVAAITKEENSLGLNPELAAMQDDLLESELQEPPGNQKEQVTYLQPAILPKNLVEDGDNTLMNEDELLMLDAKVEKVIANPREDVTDSARIGGAFTAREWADINAFIKARREGKESRSFSEWRQDTRGTTPTSQPQASTQEGQEQVTPKTPEQLEFDDATTKFYEEVNEFGDATPETKQRLQVAQQAIQPAAAASFKAVTSRFLSLRFMLGTFNSPVNFLLVSSGNADSSITIRALLVKSSPGSNVSISAICC